MKTESLDSINNEWSGSVSRRSFLEMTAKFLALAGISGCTRLPIEKIVPYVNAPEDMVPGIPKFYATAYTHGGLAHGILVESHMGRPTKIEGNPLHPSNLGTATAQQQAYILSLYDQFRSADITQNNKKSSWEKCKEQLTQSVIRAKEKQGQGLYILTELTSSPTLQDQFFQLKKTLPKMKWIQYEPISHFNSINASKNVFGKALQPIYSFDEATTVVCFDADIFNSPLYPARYAHDFMSKRRSDEGKQNLTSLFVIEPTPSLTGTWTSDRLNIAAKEIPTICQELLHRLQKNTEVNNLNADTKTFLQKIISQCEGDRCLFIAGENAPVVVHEICHHLNSIYGKKTVNYIEAFLPAERSPLEELKKLSQDLQSGQVETLITFGANPVYNSPTELQFASAIAKAKKSFHFSFCQDETANVSEWRVPLAHPLESWSDARAFDGTVTLIQPLIEPLFDGKSIHNILSLFSDQELSDYQCLQKYWKSKLSDDFEKVWNKALSEGIISSKPNTVSPKSNFKTSGNLSTPSNVAGEIEIIFRPDETIWDGRFFNNPWLQELPKPLTKLTWENVAIVSSQFAKKEKLKNGQMIVIKTNKGTIKAPVFALPRQATNSITVAFGYGRKSGLDNKAQGYNAYSIWDADSPFYTTGTVTILDELRELPCTQTHHEIDKDIVKTITKEKIPHTSSIKTPNPSSALMSDPISADNSTNNEILDSKKNNYKKNASLFPNNPLPEAEEAWAMTIDLDSCTGCSACVVACQSENNIPVVGRDGVLQKREMHWIRVDHYFSEAESYFQPIPCMHCEKAPCELVCPVGATVHSDDGLNQMVYNRCIGTRYCSNNCPYKVRRFNFFSLNSDDSELLRLQKNPQVSVRSRGIMEKCTYCVQRIQAARISAKKENRSIADGEIQTACQATCPTKAITFGNKNDLQATVTKMRNNPRSYVLLEELGTVPRTTYLAKIKKGPGHA
ncbi:MAG: 4Fe-4S dicluster domain-containing protein [Bdellovibrio sp.]